MENFLLSIITISYNNDEGLEKTLSSVFTQNVKDYSSFEYIVIDGASKDKSKDILEKYKTNNSKLNFTYNSEPDKGIYNAMNKGLQKTSGKYIYMLNSGDYLEPDVLDDMLEELKKEPDLLLFEINHVKEIGTVKTEVRYPVMLNEGAMGHQGMIYKRSFHDQYGLYNENYKCASDYEFCVKAFLNKDLKIKTIYKPCVNFICGGVGESKKSIEEFNQIRINYGLANAKKKSMVKKILKAFIPYGILKLYQNAKG